MLAIIAALLAQTTPSAATSPFDPARHRLHDLHGPAPVDIAAISPTDVWEVGVLWATHHRPADLAYTAHWDGASWTKIPTPSPGALSSVLLAVDAVSSDDVWAVGYYRDVFPGPNYPLVLHWDGVSWTQSTFPADVGPEDVSAVSSTDVWIVGAKTAHWNGDRWRVVRSTTVDSPVLLSVSAISPNDVWSGGFTYPSGETHDNPLTEHWNGKRWKVVPVAESDASNGWVQSMYGADSDHVWAVGYSYYAPHKRLFEQWDGTHWTTVDAPPFDGLSQPAIDGTSPANAWAVGGPVKEQALLPITHWDGTSWSDVSFSLPLDVTYAYLKSVTTDAADDAWAIGREFKRDESGDSFQYRITLHWDGTTWTSQ
jgi:hypothetical protein